MTENLMGLQFTKSSFLPQLDTSQAQEYFHEGNVTDFVGTYFTRAHPRARIVNEAYFDLETISTPLLLSIFLLGAICCRSGNFAFLANRYSDMAEYTVFENPTFLQLMYQKRESGTDCMTEYNIELIQAAIFIIVMQLSSSSAETRRRIRVQRYPALVFVARAVSLTQIKNQWHDATTPLDHLQFIENETCIRYVLTFESLALGLSKWLKIDRLMASIFSMDCHFVMFCNNPPYLTLAEMSFDLPTEETGFDLLDDTAWELWAMNERRYPRPAPLNQFMQELLCDQWAGADDTWFYNINVFVMFIVISGEISSPMTEA